MTTYQKMIKLSGVQGGPPGKGTQFVDIKSKVLSQ